MERLYLLYHSWTSFESATSQQRAYSKLYYGLSEISIIYCIRFLMVAIHARYLYKFCYYLYMRREETQLAATEWFIAPIICSTCFGHFLCPSSGGSRDYMCVIAAYGVHCLGCWWSGVRCRQQAMRPG